MATTFLALAALAVSGVVAQDHSSHDHGTEEGMKQHNALLAADAAKALAIPSLNGSYTSFKAAAAAAASAQTAACCEGLMYDTEARAAACASAHGKTGAHKMGDSYMVGSAHSGGGAASTTAAASAHDHGGHGHDGEHRLRREAGPNSTVVGGHNHSSDGHSEVTTTESPPTQPAAQNACPAAKAAAVSASAKLAAADAACAGLDYGAEAEAKACAVKHGKTGAHKMGSKWQVGSTHSSDSTAAPGAGSTAAPTDASAVAKAVADAAAKAYTAAGCDKDPAEDGCAELEKAKAAADAKVAELAEGNSASGLAASIAAVLLGAMVAMFF